MSRAAAASRKSGWPPSREHYYHFGGVSPINGQCRDLIAALSKEFAAHGVTLPIYWGNRNWDPYLSETIRQMRLDGVERALAFVTSPYGSYSSCRQYLDDIELARSQVGPGAPVIHKIRHYHDHPGHVTRTPTVCEQPSPNCRRGTGPPPGSSSLRTRSRPRSRSSSGPGGGTDRYVSQLREACALVAAEAAPDLPWDLVYQSRSGTLAVPWLEPDVNDHLRALAADGVTSVVVSPIGFVSDHLEVVWDIDNEAAATAAEVGLEFARAATPGTHPAFVAMIRELVAERTEEPPPARRALGHVPTWDACPADCCPAPARIRPAAATMGG